MLAQTQIIPTPWRLLTLALFCSALFLASEAQNAIPKTNAASQLMQKTSFSCAGRPAGYYADVETGCQVYHMCDGLGRQFSYTCPNTTLFQQRMLICDHWYMVNCSKAESNYAANLLIGQRDKPFVNDEENSLRTPRPDLLDRPYAPDYSGESFRSQYKQFTSSQNQIRDESVKGVGASKLDPQISQTRWRIPPPSRTILPPAYEPQIELPSAQAAKPRVPITTSTTTTTRATTTTRPTTTTRATTTTTTTRKPPVTARRTEALHNRRPSLQEQDMDDLGTSHSTRYNTSADFNSAESPLRETKQSSTKLTKFIKPPSKIYEPPFVYPIYNLEESQSQNGAVPTTLRTSTAAPFSAVPSRKEVSTTTPRPLSRPTTLAGVPFSFATHPTTVTTVGVPPRSDNRTPAPAQSFRLATPTTTAAPPSRPAQMPFNDLLPPFVDFVPHDIATTQGPPIYYEWKVPSNGLEPPKLDPPIGVDGREYPESTGDYGVTSKQDIFNSRLNDIGSHQKKPVQTTSPLQQSSTSHRLAISRSIKPKDEEKLQPEPAQRRSDVVTSSTDISHLRKQLLIPEYAFPLETIGRTGYGPGAGEAIGSSGSSSGDLYNSFQLKIPEQRAKWFGENPKCPECHPSFVLPGSCEPCLRR
ncbi:mucin-2 isoform X1 [Drosophila santomea]|uniref:mucin-2 isoform X1 n=2 Tax=Drosophila santomea TaxID=129105 RepID=UPI00195403DC|nr:mucin-2 isoform X1 [Drosophila santomea]XP_039493584.1 mucin-2 isoform X1 [Drosophila santomea]